MAVRGFKIDTLTGDLDLDDAGRMVVLDDSDDQATAQEIATRLQFFKGECAKDLREGVPYYQEILRKGADLGRVRAIVRQVIASVPAVVDVPSVEVTLDRATRAATVTWTARTRRGSVIRSEDFGPLVIEP